MDIKELTEHMHAFVGAMGWYDPGTPRPQMLRNLTISLSLEANEVLEHFQWDEGLDDPQGFADELADVALYLLQIASLSGVDLEQAILHKLQKNYTRKWDQDKTPNSRPIHHIDRIIDSCLATQNQCGGFGVPLNSSACEDIDSIDPLVRFSFITDYRKEDILQALERSLPWILVNANPDGGWVFRRYEGFLYGHEHMRTEAEGSSMFPDWFRTLTLAYLGKRFVNTPLGSYPWTFLSSPGLQYWKA